MSDVVIVDYGMGNLRSVQKALERVGAQAAISSQPSQVADARRLVLPGVGAFGDAMAELEQRQLVEPIRHFLDSQRPFLGICLGLQLLFDSSDEGAEESGGAVRGLGVLPGRVVRFPASDRHKVPHMGWNQVTSCQESPLMVNIDTSSWFYFVHSYYVVPERSEDVWLESDYIVPFCAAVRRGAVHATQFHPEKSQRVGLKLLANFVTL